jgi:hypothetical protein
MRFCGQISIELPDGDYFAAADHKRRLDDILAYVRAVYPQATLALRERRRRRTAPPLLRAAPRAPTGALHAYAED